MRDEPLVAANDEDARLPLLLWSSSHNWLHLTTEERRLNYRYFLS